jgi:hypothetical protein
MPYFAGMFPSGDPARKGQRYHQYTPSHTWTVRVLLDSYILLLRFGCHLTGRPGEQ